MWRRPRCTFAIIQPCGGPVSIVTTNPSSGTYAARLTQTTANNSLIKNANIGIGVVTPGMEITISFDARGSTANGGVIFAEFFSEIAGGGVSAAEILGGGPLALNAGSDVWTTYTFTAMAGPDVSGGVTLQLGAVCGAAGGCNADVYFDNISITAVPVPAAVWLFGSALGVFGWLKRRAA